MTAAVRDNRLGHRADVAAFEGTWSQLLAGVNDTMAAFADLEGRRKRAERELGDFFELSLDLLCIANLDGYFTPCQPGLRANARIHERRAHVATLHRVRPSR